MFLCITRKALYRCGALALILVCSVIIFALAPREKEQQITPTAASTNATLEWGLSFPEKGVPPTPNESAETLRPYDAFYCEANAGKTLYLTFDAGFENGYTGAILDTLKQHEVPATFFVVASYVKENPELVQRMVAEGHTVGNHTDSHPDMSQKSHEAFTAELQAVENAYSELIGTPMTKVYRPPQGKFSIENLQWAQGLGYKTVFWSLAYVDWLQDDQPSRETAMEKLLPRTYDGTIVLLHSTSATNAEVLDELLTKWAEMGYTFADISTLGTHDVA